MSFLPFAPLSKKSSPEQQKASWETIHACLRSSGSVVLLEAALLGAASVYVGGLAGEGSGANAFGARLAAKSVKTLRFGAALFGMLGCALLYTYPRPDGYPPHSAIKRLQVSRMLMVFLGAVNAIRGITIIQDSRWIETFGPRSPAAKAATAVASAVGATGGALPVALDAEEDASFGDVDPERTWRGGGATALIMVVLGFTGVTLSYWCGRQLRDMRAAFRFTKSFKSK